MRNTLPLNCPECDAAETAEMGPTIYIGADVGMTVNEIRCSKCGYVGPNGDPSEAWE